MLFHNKIVLIKLIMGRTDIGFMVFPCCEIHSCIYIHKAQTRVGRLYSVSKDFLDKPQQSKYIIYGKAHAHA